MAKNTTIETRVTMLDASTTANEESDAYFRQDFVRTCIQVINPNAVTVEVQISIDGDNWLQYEDDITGDAFVVLPLICPWVRVVRDATTDEVTVKMRSSEKERS